MEFADGVSILALVVSGASFVWASQIEGRLRRQADARYAFDGLYAQPIEAKLAILEVILEKMANVALTTSSCIERAEKIGVVQRVELNPWYFSFDALVSSHEQLNFGTAFKDFEGFMDDILEPINCLGQDISTGDVDKYSADLTKQGMRFIQKMRAQIHEARLTLTG